MELYITGTGQRMWVHDKAKCDSKGCPIHGPSEHHMRGWATNYREDRGLTERICCHGVGHPDPDSVSYGLKFGKDISSHGCDGCCSPPRNQDLTKVK